MIKAWIWQLCLTKLQDKNNLKSSVPCRLKCRLQQRYSLCGTVLKCFESYLCNRTQFLNKRVLSVDVPQGSVLGLYYTPYIHLLSVILWRVIISITHHLYADDSQVYLAFKINDASSIKNRIESCVGNICRWMNHNDLRERTYNWSCARLFEISWWPFAGLREHWKWKDLLIW